MKIGVNTSSLDSAVADAVEAERLGFDYLGCGEHLFFHGPTPNASLRWLRPRALPPVSDW